MERYTAAQKVRHLQHTFIVSLARSIHIFMYVANGILKGRAFLTLNQFRSANDIISRKQGNAAFQFCTLAPPWLSASR
jgi:hypothetical protein